MFLPVLLLRDLGTGGFLVFAIPNVLGAAAMGWVLRSQLQSRGFVEQHIRACVWFSLVTIIFHAFFAAWMIRRVGGHSAGLGIAVALGLFWMILQLRNGNFLGAGLALVVSVLAMASGFYRGDLPMIAMPIPGRAMPAIDILWLAPVCVFGFLLCPYLDLTFHAARQDTSRYESRAAFTLGFCGFFAMMILFTRAYSGWLVSGFARDLFPQVALILCVHFVVQSCFTVTAHVQQLGMQLRQISIPKFIFFCLAFVAIVFLGAVAHRNVLYHGLESGEVVYRCFLGFYGLVFPAYVWLCVVPPRRSQYHFLLAVFIAAPMFWLAMIEQQMVWAVPGVLAPIVAKLAGGWTTTPKRFQATAD
ncbi:MAG: hypothetical protein M3O30_13075 [Planctomycetota bacterium]|nr:hypothetical protein [Planctomycetota bacterium]